MSLALTAPALTQLPVLGWIQLIAFIGNIDVWLHSRAPRGAINFRLNSDPVDERPIPGDFFRFDPLGLGATDDDFAALRLKEIKNGRLALIAFGGILHQQLITKTGTFAYLSHFKPGFGPFDSVAAQ